MGAVQEKSKTWNATANQWNFPQTPARVQLSIWPGGAASNAQGTIDWAGGPIDWNSEAIQQDGYYYATVSDVTIECYNADSGPGTNKGKSYTYDNWLATNDTVVDGNKPTVLKSLLGSGLDMDADYPSSSASQTTKEVVPGLSGGGPGTNGQAAGDANGGNGNNNGGNGNGNSGTPSNGGSSDCNSGFSQDCGNNSSDDDSNKNQGARQEHVLGASAFAALIAVAGMVWL